ncbi:hypothetical protein H0H92_008152, partial [Tricholoma furcatifolium]
MSESYSHYPTSHPHTLVGINARERYIDALEEVRAAEANYLAAEAARRKEEIVARRLAQIEMRKQAELLRAANYIDLYQADYVPFHVYAQRRGFEAGLSPCHCNSYYHDIDVSYMHRMSSHVTPPATLGSIAKRIALCESLEHPVYIKSPASRTAPSVYCPQQLKHLRPLSMASKPLNSITRAVEVPQQTVAKALDAIQQTQSTPTNFANPNDKLLKSFAALFGIDVFDHPVVHQQERGPIPSTTHPEAPGPLQTVVFPLFETPKRNASAIRKPLSWSGAGASEGQPARQASCVADQHDSVNNIPLYPSKSRSQPRTTTTFSTSVNPASPELKSSFSKIPSAKCP